MKKSNCFSLEWDISKVDERVGNSIKQSRIDGCTSVAYWDRDSAVVVIDDKIYEASCHADAIAEAMNLKDKTDLERELILTEGRTVGYVSTFDVYEMSDKEYALVGIDKNSFDSLSVSTKTKLLELYPYDTYYFVTTDLVTEYNL